MPSQVTIDASKKYQTMNGFGATTLSLVYPDIGDTLTPSLRASALDAIYNQVKLNMGNLEGALGEPQNDSAGPFTYNGDGFQTQAADAMYSRIVKRVSFGSNDFYLSQKINTHWGSPWLADLRTTDYATYLNEAAEQVAAGHLYWRNNYGIVFPYQQLFNEPTTGNVELMNGTVQDVVDITKRTGARLASEGFQNIRFVFNEESEETSLRTALAVLNDPTARPYLGAIGYHTYPYDSVYSSIRNILATSGADRPDPTRIAVRNQLRDLGAQYGLPVWMSKVSHGGDPLSFDDLRGRAIHIHDELVYANASAYFGMWNMWDMTSQQIRPGNSNLFDPANEGTIVLIDNPNNVVYITGMGYAIGHYARWINKGAVRVDAQSTVPLLQVVGFIDNSTARVVLVLINNRNVGRTVTVGLNQARLNGNLSGEQSTSQAYWQRLNPIVPSNATQFVVQVPPLSVTTVAGSVVIQNP
jgi:O-glycosyl hydrolase